jgi:hypothetical protein
MKKYFGKDAPIKTEQEYNSVFERQCKITAKTLKISIHEARKRYTALHESGLLDIVDPRELEGQKAVDIFLANTYWETNPELVLMATKRELAFPEVFLKCISEEEMVKNFDRLRGGNLWELVKGGTFKSENEREVSKQIKKFEKFVREFVWSRLPLESFK